MKTFSLASVAVLATSVLAQNATSTSSAQLTEYTLQAENITAVILPYGARLVSLLVPDRNGVAQDVAVGYDNGSQYPVDTATNHTYFGAVVGRYANRIKNGTFTIGGNTFRVPANEHNGTNTLHGGTIGYDQRNWTVAAVNGSAITLTLLDTGFENFPGTVLTTATFAVSAYPSGPQGQMRPRFTTRLVSVALDQPTPIMLSNHIYWNLNAFQAENILNDTYYWMPYSDRYIQTDGNLIPNGTFGMTADNPGLNFQSPKLVGTAVDQTAGHDYCGTNCTGIDNAFCVDRPVEVGQTSLVPVFHAWSETTGIQMDVSTNQIGLQIFTCMSQDGSIPIKQAQRQRNQGVQGATQHINKFGCFALEPQVYIDGINNPQWGVNGYEIFSPTTGPSVNHATYDFSSF
ncbi:hypothetical protein LTR64_004451 [Lithohypha guttulata]|uniref:Aldose 1-epimerase n=1 Tax=Lithohypha guttulata TaxID=1690604 RepID=A0AAN7T335_9EURO|nr:hypothetical protein LTR51_006254 [Lithohypha guttulata]KAK5088460.1 hypothetical protein LTR05_002678 [Lithohypha guttulata]